MKKILSAMVVLLFGLAMVACAQSKGSQSNSQPQRERLSKTLRQPRREPAHVGHRQ